MWWAKYVSGVSPKKGPMTQGMSWFIHPCARVKSGRCEVQWSMRMKRSSTPKAHSAQ
jgi:hypothetical protein